MVKKIKKSIIKKKVASTNKAKWVYNFEDTPRADKQSLKNLLGGKGANLVRNDKRLAFLFLLDLQLQQGL
jgi:hypothetical protein